MEKKYPKLKSNLFKIIIKYRIPVDNKEKCWRLNAYESTLHRRQNCHWQLYPQCTIFIYCTNQWLQPAPTCWPSSALATHEQREVIIGSSHHLQFDVFSSIRTLNGGNWTFRNKYFYCVGLCICSYCTTLPSALGIHLEPSEVDVWDFI